MHEAIYEILCTVGGITVAVAAVYFIAWLLTPDQPPTNSGEPLVKRGPGGRYVDRMF